MPIDPLMNHKTAYEIPSIVPNSFEEGSGGVPRIKEHKVRVAAQAIAGIAEQRSGHVVFRRAAFPPQAHAQRDAKRPVRPYQQDEAEAIHRLALLAGKHPGQTFDGRGKRLRNHCIVDDEIAPLPDEERAQRELKESAP